MGADPNDLPTLSELAIPASTIDADLEAVKAALAGVQPRPGRVLLFGSRARGDARPDSDLDLLVVMPSPRSSRRNGNRRCVCCGRRCGP